MQGKAGGCNFEGLQFAIQKAHNGAFPRHFPNFQNTFKKPATPIKKEYLRISRNISELLFET